MAVRKRSIEFRDCHADFIIQNQLYIRLISNYLPFHRGNNDTIYSFLETQQIYLYHHISERKQAKPYVVF